MTMYQSPYETGGIRNPNRKDALIEALSGGTAAAPANAPGVQADTTAPAQTQAAPSYGKSVGQYGNQLEGFDAGKLNSEHASPKYLIGRTLSNFDPRQGVTPEVLSALNSLGIGQFSGSKDKLSIANGDPRFEGVNALDVVRDFEGGGGWQYGVEGGPTAAPAARGGFGLGLNPTASIGGALQNLAGTSDTQTILQRLIAELSGAR